MEFSEEILLKEPYSLICRLLKYVEGLKIRQIFIKNNIVVVLYHSINKDMSFLLKGMGNDIYTEVNKFEKQIKFLHENFNIIGLEKLLKPNEIKKIPPGSLAITFDDGYRDSYIYAYPILKKYNVKATVCINTSFLNNNDMFWWSKYNLIKKYGLENNLKFNERISLKKLMKESHKKIDNLFNFILEDNAIKISENCKKYNLYLNINDIKDMDSELIKICSHSHSHYKSLDLSYGERVFQIKTSLNIIKELFPRHYIPVYSFPFGIRHFTFDEVDIKILKREGVECFLSASGGTNKKRFNREIYRNSICSDIDEEKLIASLYKPYRYRILLKNFLFRNKYYIYR